MNILLITTCFPPDSAIAAVRAYMFAKHLSGLGNSVTVLRSGEFELAPFDEYPPFDEFEVISALGKNCPAEKYKRNEYEGFIQKPVNIGNSLPRYIRLPLKTARDAASIIRCRPPKCIRQPGTILKYQKKSIDRLLAKGKSFDIVWATCGGIENIYAGNYAKKAFDAKWIMDFRDSMIFSGSFFDNPWWNKFAKEATLCALDNADCVTAVGQELSDELNKLRPEAKIEVIHNGFDDTEPLPNVQGDPDTLSLCYTGRLYEDRKPALKALVRCIAGLIKQKRIDRRRIRVNYAGASFDEFERLFRTGGIPDVLTNKGYLSKHDTTRLQLENDIFIVLSWNTKHSRGILTGKFYEGIKCGKPILALISGELPYSELWQLEKEYSYGFCFEQSRSREMMAALEDYIEGLYLEKISNGRLSYNPTDELYNAFCYTNLSRELLKLMTQEGSEEGI